MFLLNSRLGLLTAAPQGCSPQRAPLLPKLRGQFAEFLNEGSPVHLGVLTPAHLCRFAVRAPAASPPGLFSAPRIDRIALPCGAAAPPLGRVSPACELGGGISNATPGLPHGVLQRDLIVCKR